MHPEQRQHPEQEDGGEQRVEQGDLHLREHHLPEGRGHAAGAADQLARQRPQLRQRQLVVQRDHRTQHHADQDPHADLHGRGAGDAELLAVGGGPVVHGRAQGLQIFRDVRLQQVRHLVAGGVEDVHQAHQQRIGATGLIAEERGDADRGQGQRADDQRRQHDHRIGARTSGRQPALDGGGQQVGQVEHQQA